MLLPTDLRGFVQLPEKLTLHPALAGTTAKVFMEIVGKQAMVLLQLDNDKDNFQRGRTDTFQARTDFSDLAQSSAFNSLAPANSLHHQAEALLVDLGQEVPT